LNGKNGVKMTTETTTTTETTNFFKDIYNIEKKTGKRVFSEIVKLRIPMIKEEFIKANKTANCAVKKEGQATLLLTWR
jgi:hypothetical protein